MFWDVSLFSQQVDRKKKMSHMFLKLREHFVRNQNMKKTVYFKLTPSCDVF